MAPTNSVTEVVEIPLAVPFSEFIWKFQLDLLPVLLKEEGVISVRTGTKIKTSENTSHSWAVSLTEWDSLESHAKFVEKESSASFFVASEKLSRGPPNINHYSFGSLRALADSGCSRLIFSTEPLGIGLVRDAICAESIERSGTFCALSPVKEGTAIPQLGHEKAFDVKWYSYERKMGRPSL